MSTDQLIRLEKAEIASWRPRKCRESGAEQTKENWLNMTEGVIRQTPRSHNPSHSTEPASGTLTLEERQTKAGRRGIKRKSKY